MGNIPPKNCTKKTRLVEQRSTVDPFSVFFFFRFSALEIVVFTRNNLTILMKGTNRMSFFNGFISFVTKGLSYLLQRRTHIFDGERTIVANAKLAPIS